MRRTSNPYVKAMGDDLFEDCPKAILGAIAVSALTSGGDELNLAHHAILLEWWVLYENGIVGRKPSMPKPKPRF